MKFLFYVAERKNGQKWPTKVAVKDGQKMIEIDVV